MLQMPVDQTDFASVDKLSAFKSVLTSHDFKLELTFFK